ncbi:MAG TPA: 1-deoxy-D-xylulose-5-phosphate reductoisomerase [Syntrophorhabdaceae bacterium]|nr:1-deoxy-D-xylulose-5-phosphate reductoisomerase [Syntrophorhabdaceae bacterium]HQM82587.1 1-deoxy-D-xylulose-5-phosphate reductoisomerase [Syntrophorhabdaceae bacterium]
MKKKILILGSTGSIGRSTLEVIGEQQDAFEVFGLACKGQADLLNRQIEKFRPRYVCIYDEGQKDKVNFDKNKLFTGINGMKAMIGMDSHIVVNALPGSIGLEPSLEAFRCRKILALANKESLVMAGRIITKMVKKSGAKLIPVDSEHSALYQLLKNIKKKELKTIMITASGGPFRKFDKDALEGVRPEEALNHPTWKMGQKITLDSATLMNKGLEVIEARWLFNIDPSRIRVIVHPESIIHGIVEYVDHSFIAYMAYPDMKIPIAYALNESARKPIACKPLSLEDISTLTFHTPDLERFPSLRLAYEALASGDSALIALNASNEVASQAFIEGRIRFTDIPVVVEDTLEHHPAQAVIEDVETIREIHQWATEYAENKFKTL